MMVLKHIFLSIAAGGVLFGCGEDISNSVMTIASEETLTENQPKEGAISDNKCNVYG